MSGAYRESRSFRLGTPERVAAYLVTRMPATYAACYAVLGEVRERIGAVNSVLDVGAGTGSAPLAALECFPGAAITMIDHDAAMLDAAREWLPEARMIQADAGQMLALPPHDLVVAAYSFGEFQSHIAERLWQAARVALVVIQPGTPSGFGTVLLVRDQLLDTGAYMVAPCPAAMPCPVVEPDWCHFAARVERSSLHRRIKDGELGYEDEKYSYVALAREPAALPRARIVRRPQHHSGWIELQTCTSTGLTSERATKRNPQAFREARKAQWGEALS